MVPCEAGLELAFAEAHSCEPATRRLRSALQCLGVGAAVHQSCSLSGRIRPSIHG